MLRLILLLLIFCSATSSFAEEAFDISTARRTLVETNMQQMVIVDKLFSKQQPDRISAIDQVLGRPESATPPVLYALTGALMSEGRSAEAIFWYHVAKMRVSYDLRRNRDKSLGDIPQVLAMRLPKPLLQEVYFEHLDSSLEVVKSAIEWDDKHAHDYNPLWPTPHGLGVFNPGEEGLAPEPTWQAINDSVHAQWLGAMSKIVADAKAKQEKH